MEVILAYHRGKVDQYVPAMLQYTITRLVQNNRKNKGMLMQQRHCIVFAGAYLSVSHVAHDGLFHLRCHTDLHYMLLDVIAAAAFYNPALCLVILDKSGTLPVVFTHWMQAIPCDQ